MQRNQKNTGKSDPDENKVIFYFPFTCIIGFLFVPLQKNQVTMQTFELPGRLCKTQDIQTIAQQANDKYVLIYQKPHIQWVAFAQERMQQIMDDTQAVMAYADHFHQLGETITQAPVIDYQMGALRDDFEFGSVWMVRTSALKEAAKGMNKPYDYAGLYDLRLRLSRLGELEHINEYLYYDIEEDTRKSGEKLFDYVDPKNRGVQLEMEDAVTEHLKAIGGYLKPEFKEIDLTEGNFACEASVIIPCKNRVRTIRTAIESALSQKVTAPYRYNVIVVDDNSTDGTVEEIKSLVKANEMLRAKDANAPELIYIAQDKTWHAIGGNWNMALHHEKCGRFAIQLDSDDTYHDETTVQQFIDAFHAQKCAMVVGTYCLTDFDGNMLPPGVIDHKEWTPENGRNNALRINGLGAPRGFYTPLLRKLNFPTTKYGEDYAVGLRVSREYQVGRIYNVLYHCRRWDDNSDANCDIEAMNKNNLYKDRIRTWELKARIAR